MITVCGSDAQEIHVYMYSKQQREATALCLLVSNTLNMMSF